MDGKDFIDINKKEDLIDGETFKDENNLTEVKGYEKVFYEENGKVEIQFIKDFDKFKTVQNIKNQVYSDNFTTIFDNNKTQIDINRNTVKLFKKYNKLFIGICVLNFVLGAIIILK